MAAGTEAGVVSAHGSGGRGRERKSARDFQIAALWTLFPIAVAGR